MKRKSGPNFTKHSARLSEKHTWNAPKGYKIVVMERGAASFNIPEAWLVVKMNPLEIHDGAPPDDNARLMVTLWHLPPGVDWSGLPLKPMLLDSVNHGKHKLLSTSKPIEIARGGAEIVWLEQLFIDPVEEREAYSRIAVARGFDVQLLITFDFWKDDAARCTPVWDEVIHSLQLGREIENPLKGPTLH